MLPSPAESIVPSSLSSLPWVVQDNILSRLNQRWLLSLSLTSTFFYHTAKKHIYRDLTDYETYRALVQSNLRRDPTLIPYIQSFTSYDDAFLMWMWPHRSRSLTDLELQFDNITDHDPYTEFFDSISRGTRLERLTFGLTSEPGLYFLRNKLPLIDGLTSLRLEFPRNQAVKYTLQNILVSLHAPSLEYLEVGGVLDWRIKWRDSFDVALPNLRGLQLWKLELNELSLCVDERSGRRMRRPGEDSWDGVMALHRRSIYFNITYNCSTQLDDGDAFTVNAPYYASLQKLNPVPLIRWLFESKKYFATLRNRTFFALIGGCIPTLDRITILNVLKSLDFNEAGRDVGLHLILPSNTLPSIANCLPSAITSLYINPNNLNPSVVPECIRSLPNLSSVWLYTLIRTGEGEGDLQCSSGCTAAKYVLPSTFVARNLSPSIFVTFLRDDCPDWDIDVDNEATGENSLYKDPGGGVGDFKKGF
jgi:hypothetical protein